MDGEGRREIIREIEAAVLSGVNTYRGIANKVGVSYSRVYYYVKHEHIKGVVNDSLTRLSEAERKFRNNLVSRGLSLGEMRGMFGGISRQAVHDYLLRSNLHSDWRDKRKRMNMWRKSNEGALDCVVSK